MKIISVRENRSRIPLFVDYFARCWSSGMARPIYQNCIENAPDANFCLPQWYLLLQGSGDIPIGCVGLITNDFISRMDLLPWLCALYVEPEHRGKGLGTMLIEHACAEAGRMGYSSIYLCTEHNGFYERKGFSYIGDGYHPWGDKSRIYKRSLIGVPVNPMAI